MWNWIGAALAGSCTLLALRQARLPSASFYEMMVYGMSAHSHCRFALLSASFTLVFLAGNVWARLPTLPLLGLYTVLAILYGASFVRGATGEDEW
ncbi:MAG: hypothetical protein M3160_03540 [Candidatus Eremiobacteraeota bacterium]|nr:hypothetical protein [Candidatus Eremiobacteraeota bacterium]